MPVSSAEQKHHDLLAWAAYVLGHHPLFLCNWLTWLWNARQEVFAGKCGVDDEIPIEANELIEAIHVISRQAPIAAGTAVDVATAAERFRQGCVDVIRTLKSSDPHGDIDWGSDYPPGAEYWPLLVKGIGEIFRSQLHLEQWRHLGERVAG